MYLHSNSDSYHSSPSQSPPYHKQKHIQQAFHRFGVQVRPNQTVSQFKKSASLKIGLLKPVKMSTLKSLFILIRRWKSLQW